jgi:hypothetical protein
MRQWMAAQAEKPRTGQQHARWQVGRVRRAAISCPLEAALRADVRSWAARIRGTEDHAGGGVPYTRDRVETGWSTAIGWAIPICRPCTQSWCAIGKPILHHRLPAEGRSARQAHRSPMLSHRAFCSEGQRQRSAGANRRCPVLGRDQASLACGTASRPGRAVMPVEGGRSAWSLPSREWAHDDLLAGRGQLRAGV